MPVEGNAYAALVTELETMLQLDGKSRFLSFPRFLVRLSLEDLLFEMQAVLEHTGLTPALAQREAVLNLEFFALMVNQIPESSSTFLGDGRMLWSIYERVIATAKLATGGNESEIFQTAQLFQHLRNRFVQQGSSQLGGGPFCITGILPPNDLTDSSGWTPMRLDQGVIDQRSQETTPTMRTWLADRGLLETVDESGVKAISLRAEVFLLTLQRNWFDPEVFRNRLWRWDDALLSDGGDTAHGLLPAYVTQLVLIRKLQVELDFASAAPFSHFAPAVDFATYSFVHAVNGASAFSTVAANVNAAPQPLPLLAHTPDPSQALSLRQFAKLTLSEEPNSGNALAFGPLGNQTVGFPAPVTFLTRRVVDQIAAAQVKVDSELTVLSDRLTELQRNVSFNDLANARLQHQVDSYPPDALTVTIDNDAVEEPYVIDVVALRESLAEAKRNNEIDRARGANMARALAVHNEHARDLQQLRQSYESFPLPGDDSDIFVLGFVCSAVPKAPDPDPAFFT